MPGHITNFDDILATITRITEHLDDMARYFRQYVAAYANRRGAARPPFYSNARALISQIDAAGTMEQKLAALEMCISLYSQIELVEAWAQQQRHVLE